MAVTILDLEDIKETLQEKKEKSIKQNAEREMLIKTLKEEYGVDSEEDGIELLEQSLAEIEELKEEFEKEVSDFLLELDGEL